ncbi:MULTISPECIES: extracellular solute-binding protein [unclassified Paenibacillus]|uniref:extracellular solute-binding protein n=1 Tax=unclassified Paenibacillus TaxID=185978 RepID=UPI0008B2E935|nr:MULTISPECIES: extracellular solute-binding protein [unclassified Paenibacillus]QLG41502.1 extracellular solute-binding protein [Paenibacillus sp. E222]SEN20867.1 carbohydrate ABC transporter substrate-binding protein, CUT1 family [Paenibacillus sp. OK076]
MRAKSTKKRWLPLLATTTCLAVILSACGGGNSGGENAGSSTPAVENEYKEKYDPAVTITTAWGIDPELKFKNGESMENNVATKWAKDKFGIEIKSLWSVTDTNSAFATKLRLAMSSGQEMPDVVTIGQPDNLVAQDLIDSGMYQEVGPLFDKYASDTWKKAMEQDPNVWNQYSRDGKKMGIPVLDYAYNNDYLLWIRQDWLDKLNLEAPKTIDELETVMEAFKNKNPDGLTPDKVTPLSIGFKTSMNTWMGDPSWIFGAYGTLPQQWNLGADGKLEYGSINPGMKQGLTKLSEWLKKGYIPQEAALWDENKTAEPAVAGTAGIIPGPYWMSGWPLIDTVKNVPSAVWKPIAIPAGPDGKAMRHGTQFVNGVTLIKKDMEHPEAFFTYQNYLFDNYADPAKGSPYDNGLFEGYDYQLDANGKQVKPADMDGGYVNVVRYLLVRDGARIPDAQMKALMNLADGKEPETKLEKDVAVNYGPETPAAAKELLDQKDISFKNMFTGPTTSTMKSKLDYLNKIENQTFNEIIYGKNPVDAFDTFVQTWKSGGGDQITQEVNEWYDSVKK